MLKLLLTLLISFFLLPSAQAQFIAGNHGEGVLLSDRVYLRDLSMYGVAQSPSFYATVPDAIILLKLVDFDRLPLSEDQKFLLMLKLTDIEQMAPCLGIVLTDLLYHFSWTFTSETLPVPTEQQEVSRVEEGERVVVAKRIYSDILLQQRYWDKMPDAHKVALIIHELLYSLLTPVKFPHVPGAAFQDVNIVRAVISNLFSLDSNYASSKFKNQLRYFDIPKDLTCAYPSFFTINFVDVYENYSFTARRGQTALKKDMKLVCTRASVVEGPFDITVRTGSYKIDETPYLAFDGKDESNGFAQQTWIRVLNAEPQRKSHRVGFYHNIDMCVREATKFISRWSDPLDTSISEVEH